MCEQLVGKDQLLRNLSDIVYSFKRQISHMSIPQFLVHMHPQTKLVWFFYFKANLKNVPVIQSVMDSYSSASSSFLNSVDTVSLKLKITSSGNSLNSDFKESLVQDVLNLFEDRKNNLPQFHPTGQDMRSFNGTITQIASSITSNQNQITSYESEFWSGNLSDTLKEVDKFTNLDPSFESTVQLLECFSDALLGTLGQGQSFINLGIHLCRYVLSHLRPREMSLILRSGIGLPDDITIEKLFSNIFKGIGKMSFQINMQSSDPTSIERILKMQFITSEFIRFTRTLFFFLSTWTNVIGKEISSTLDECEDFHKVFKPRRA